MTDAMVDEKLSAADNAFLRWRETPYGERARLLRRVAFLLNEKKEMLARLCAVEMGKIIKEGLAEIQVCMDILEYYAENSALFLADKPLEYPHGEAFICYKPIGVVFSVQPWNFPFYQVIRSTAPNLMAGNTVVLKHASNVPQCAQMAERIFTEAGVPEGVFTNLFISGPRASLLAEDDRIKGITFTGSRSSGASLAAAAGKHVKKTVMELGGSDALLVLEDAPFDKAVTTAAFKRIRNAGQACSSPKRVIVVEPLAGKFIEKAKSIYERVMVGDPLDPKTMLAPLSSRKALETVLEQVEDAVKKGASLVYGGKRVDRERAFMEPTILTGITPAMKAYSEEIFGPVLCIFVAKDEEDAIRIANDTSFGLGGSVFSEDAERAINVARRIDAGMVYINQVVSSKPELPFGGTKQSGYGRELSAAGIHAFVNAELIYIDFKDLGR